MDRQLQQAVLESLDHLDPKHRLPKSELRRIAEETILENRVTDGEWIYARLQESNKNFIRKRNIAKLRGYAPFCSLNLHVFTKLRESFGQEILDLMSEYLEDPEDIYSKWGYRFALTAHAIGIENCLKNREQIYHFVTQHPLWPQNDEKFHEQFQEWVGYPKRPQEEEQNSKEEMNGASPNSELSSDI